jgi:hypothetical protein
MIKHFIAVLGLLFFNVAFSWSINGHLLIAEVAYENLTPKARQTVDTLTVLFAKNYPQFNHFVTAAYWADDLRATDVTAFNNWHFIDRPYNQDGMRHRHYAANNVLWAIKQSEQVLQSTSAAPMNKAIFLMFLSHLVGDIHQPMHCITLYSRQFPKGDKGGTLYAIRSPTADNLHALWDHGGDFFYQLRHSNAVSMTGVQQLAQRVQRDYPKTFFSTKASDLDVKHWSYESYQLAKNIAYEIKYDAPVTTAYLAQVQQVSEQQTALAGYRLANVLNNIFT